MVDTHTQRPGRPLQTEYQGPLDSNSEIQSGPGWGGFGGSALFLVGERQRVAESHWQYGDDDEYDSRLKQGSPVLSTQPIVWDPPLPPTATGGPTVACREKKKGKGGENDDGRRRYRCQCFACALKTHTHARKRLGDCFPRPPTDFFCFEVPPA